MLPKEPFEDRTNVPGYNPDGLYPQHPAVGFSQRLSETKTIEEKQRLFQRIAESINANSSMDLQDAKDIHLAVYQSYLTVHGSAVDAQAEALLGVIESLYPESVPDLPD